MAEIRKKKRGGRFCVAGAPNQQSCKNTSYSPGITMHQFPSDPVLRRKWVKFVQRHRHDFHDPSKYASLCSVHFEESCFTRRLSTLPGEEDSNVKMNRVLVKGSVPTRDTTAISTPEPVSERQRRKVQSTSERFNLSVFFFV